ncbi:uncharacterized protein At4g02000-like [Lotus japonicus]|uniref:uncharacterized protein At4g02000-like n=1 Tax=Lotus japonicus TaxID=34305 RepID=UPI002590FC23|nr:uncharacterized protein At4g02000-like [Lotus japonicus]
MAFINDAPMIDFEGDENVVLDLGDVQADPNLEANVWLVGRVLSPKRVIGGIFRSVMLRLWETRNCKEIRHVGPNLFSFEFGSPKDRDLFLRSGPWLFDRHLVVLDVFDISKDPLQIPLTRIPFWIQVHGLPYTLRTENIAKLLGGSFDGYLGWDKYEAHRYGYYLRIRAWVNVNAPLRRGQMVATRGGAPLRVTFKYEKLVNFCFRCGRLDHVLSICKGEAYGGNLRYGAWLRAEEETPVGGTRNRGHGE